MYSYNIILALLLLTYKNNMQKVTLSLGINVLLHNGICCQSSFSDEGSLLVIKGSFLLCQTITDF